MEKGLLQKDSLCSSPLHSLRAIHDGPPFAFSRREPAFIHYFRYHTGMGPARSRSAYPHVHMNDR